MRRLVAVTQMTLDGVATLIFLLLVGDFGAGSEHLERVRTSVAGHYPGVAGYLVSLYAASGVAGNLGHRAVRRLKGLSTPPLVRPSSSTRWSACPPAPYRPR